MLSVCTEFLSSTAGRVYQNNFRHTTRQCVGGSSIFFNMLSKCLTLLRTDYLPIQMPPRYWQLFAFQQTDLLLLHPLTETWLGFRNGAITGAWYWILTKLRLKSLVDPGLWTLPKVTWSCLGFVSRQYFFIHPYCLGFHNLDIVGVMFDIELTFEDHLHGIVPRVSSRIGILRLEKCIILDSSVLLRCYFVNFVLPNPWVLFSSVGISCWMSPSDSWWSGVYGGQDFSESKFLWFGQSKKLWSKFNLWSKFKGHCGMTFPSQCLTPERSMGSMEQSTVCCFPEWCFLQFSVAQVLVGVKQFTNNFVLLFLGLCCWF